MKKLSVILFVISISTTICWGQLSDVQQENNLSSIKNRQEFQIPNELMEKHTIAGKQLERVQALNGELNKVRAIKTPVVDHPQGLVAGTAVANDSVLFRRPQGFFFSGIGRQLQYSAFFLLYGPANDSVQWINLSGGVSGYNWTLPDPQGSIESTTKVVPGTKAYTEDNPIAKYEYNIYYSTPSLTAAGSNGSSTYMWGGVDSTYMLTGGGINSLLGTGACNYDAHEGIANYTTYSDNSFMFGTTPDQSIDAVGNFFDAPAHSYLLDTLWILAAECVAPAGTEFEIIIHGFNSDGELEDTIATATTTIEEVEGPLYNNAYFNIVFDEFEVYDEDLGFEIGKPYIDIDRAIFVEFKGFNKDGVTLNVFSQIINSSPINENNAYIYYLDSETGERFLGSYNGVNTSLTFNMSMHYSYLVASDNYFDAQKGADNKMFILTSSYSLDSIVLLEALPDWLTAEAQINDETKEYYLTLKTSALPDGVYERKDTVWLGVEESTCGILVTQSSGSGIKNNKGVDDIRIVNKRGMITVSYPVDYNSLSVYNVMGKNVGNYELPHTGSYTFMPDAQIGSGVYILKFAGIVNQKNKTVKIIY